MFALFFTAYTAVLMSELVGDRTLYSLSALAARISPARVFIGALAAFVLKVAAAVVFGQFLGGLPTRFVAFISAVTFLTTAAFLARHATDDGRSPQQTINTGSPVTGAAFFTIAFTEWADPGQFATAALVAQHGRPLLVAVAATFALVTKATIAIVVGVTSRRYLPKRIVRTGAILLFLVLAASTVMDLLLN